MHLSGSPLLRETKSETCSSPSDDTTVINNSNSGGFSVIFRPGETSINSGLNNNTSGTDADTIASHRYSTHPSSRLTGIHSRADDGKTDLSRFNWTKYCEIVFFFPCTRSVILHSHSHSQAISPSTVLYQHSPSDSGEYHSHQQGQNDADQVQQHHQQQTHHHQHQMVSHHSQHQSSHVEGKYSENVNGHDTLTDFVTFVCQEAENSPQSSQVTWKNLS